MPRGINKFDRGLAARIPGVAALASLIARIAKARWGRIPIGLLALLPFAILIDAFDAADELALGPVGMAVSFVVEATFLLGLTGRASYALLFAGLDAIPFVDVLPWATITLVREIVASFRAEPDAGAPTSMEPVIDVGR